MKNVTLDTNCLYALENNETSGPDIRALVQMRLDGKINLRIAAVSASERQKNGKLISNFTEFQKRLASQGLSQLEVLKPMLRLNVAFLDWNVLADEAMIEFEEKIWKILFPYMESDYGKYCTNKGIDPNASEIDGDWLNHRCDTSVMWCHIHYNGDIFVTLDSNFLKTKKATLIMLGAKEILRPKEVVERLQSI